MKIEMIDGIEQMIIGVRTLHPSEKAIVGEMVNNSKEWDYENDCESNIYMNGACATFLCCGNEIEDIDNVDLDKIGHGVYADGETVLIAGRKLRDGDDQNEIIIGNPIVIAIMQ